MAQEEKGRGTADMPRDTIHGAGSKQKESKEGDSHAVHAVHEPREPRAEASKEGGAGVSGAAGEVHARPVQVLPASQPRQASQHGGAEQEGREASASVSGTSGPDAGSTSARPRSGDPASSSAASGVASAAEEDKVTRPAKDEAAEAAKSEQQGEGRSREGLGASGEAALGGLGLAPDSEYSKTQIITEKSDYPTDSGDGQHAVSSTGKDEQMQVDEDDPPAAADVTEEDAKGKGMEVSKPAMFAYANAPRLPPTQAPAAPRGLASLPARPSAAVSFGRSRAPLPSQNDSYATSLGAPPSHDKKDGPRPVDRSALTSLIFSATPRPASELLQLPLPSRRQTRRATGAGVLIPVERLPLLPLPPLPPILDAKVEKVVFSHQSLFPRDAGVFEYPVAIRDGDWHGGVPHYEKLEHVGDAILGGVVTTWLHRCWPGLTCGTATVSVTVIAR